MNYVTYIIKSIKTGKYYIGQTKNLLQRLHTHNTGRNKYTSPYKPWKVIYCKSFPNRSEAIKYEKYLKSLKKEKL